MTQPDFLTPQVHTWSAEQYRIFTWFESSQVYDANACLASFGRRSQHLVVVAGAGCAKTTTIIEGINRAPESSILLAAFNKSIATELQKRISNPNAKAQTLHALGFGIVMKWWNGVSVGDNRAMTLANTVCGRSVPDEIKKLVANLHTKGREINPHASKPGDLIDLAIEFDCVPPEEWEQDGFDLPFVEAKALEAMELAGSVRPTDNEIDFTDMIYLPVRNGWMTPRFALVVIDEGQDMNAAQLELAMGVCRKDGRICVVGDPNQAIYGFRGADSGSLSRLKDVLRAAQLGLKTTYRCAKSIVAEAQQFVPDFMAGDSNPEGTVMTRNMDQMFELAQQGDFILSRLNAPLVSVCLHLLRNGKRARIAGKDIGKSLQTLVRKLAKGPAAHSIPAFIERVQGWSDTQNERLRPQLLDERRQKTAQRKLEAIHDQAETLISIAEGAVSVTDLISRIESLFAEVGPVNETTITCSSVHKAKGLEAKTVFVLRDTIRTGGEEDNIAYVAITRAKSELVWVVGS